MTRSTRSTTALTVALAFGAGDPTTTGLGQLGTWFAGLLS